MILEEVLSPQSFYMLLEFDRDIDIELLFHQHDALEMDGEGEDENGWKKKIR